MYAHYFATKTQKVVIITRGAMLRGGLHVARFEVAGKVEARKIAAGYEARCWNF